MRCFSDSPTPSKRFAGGGLCGSIGRNGHRIGKIVAEVFTTDYYRHGSARRRCPCRPSKNKSPDIFGASIDWCRFATRARARHRRQLAIEFRFLAQPFSPCSEATLLPLDEPKHEHDGDGGGNGDHPNRDRNAFRFS